MRREWWSKYLRTNGVVRCTHADARNSITWNMASDTRRSSYFKSCGLIPLTGRSYPSFRGEIGNYVVVKHLTSRWIPAQTDSKRQGQIFSWFSPCHVTFNFKPKLESSTTITFLSENCVEDAIICRNSQVEYSADV